MNLVAQSNSKTGHKNISYDAKECSFIVSIFRDGHVLKFRTNTIEDAIRVRDQILKFYKEHGRLPKRSDLGLEYRDRRRLKEREKKAKSAYICKMCKKQMSYMSKSSINDFKDRGEICGHCQSKDRDYFSLDVNRRKINRLNEKYISEVFKHDRKYYIVHLDKNRVSIGRTFTSLKDAISFRNGVLNFYSENNRMPDDLELKTLFGLERSNRKYSNKPSDSDKSSTGLKNIAYEPKKDRYYVTIARDRVKSTLSFKSLEDAKFARKIMLETFEGSGVMLRNGEVRARMKEIKESEEYESLN